MICIVSGMRVCMGRARTQRHMESRPGGHGHILLTEDKTMFGYDRINERYLLENVNNYQLADWERARNEAKQNSESLVQRAMKLIRHDH